VASTTEEYSNERASKYYTDLSKQFPFLNKKQLSAIIGNLHHESGGFTMFREVNGKGVGDAQWTATRRKDFLEFSQRNKTDPTTYEGSLAFLLHELRTSHHGFTEKFLKKFNNPDLTLDQLTVMFERQFLVAGDPHWADRKRDAKTYFEKYNAYSEKYKGEI
jgi:hypothetical protein